jgi:hypothetical protein
MVVIAVLAAAVLVAVTLLNAPPANPQPLPPATQTTQDCGCGLPDSPRGPR